ncbi:hypothetical protein ACG83_18790 [Frankia sp. R43]|nr:hypothetical protein ACG83_18790 [Frankia sp. R43]
MPVDRADSARRPKSEVPTGPGRLDGRARSRLGWAGLEQSRSIRAQLPFDACRWARSDVTMTPRHRAGGTSSGSGPAATPFDSTRRPVFLIAGGTEGWE